VAALVAIVVADVLTGDQLARAPFCLVVTLAVAWYDGAAAGWVFVALCRAAMPLAGVLSVRPTSVSTSPATPPPTVVAVLLATRLREMHERARTRRSR
jgi:hypothetical protein